MTAPAMLTAAAYWEARQREGWFYCANPRQQFRAVQRLANRTYDYAYSIQRHTELDFSGRQCVYPRDLLEHTWAKMVASQAVCLWRDVPAEVLAQLPEEEAL